MSKYSPLQAYLRAQRRDEVPMTFAQIERIIGQKLPPSHRYRAWWSNNSFNSVMTKAWLEAGFKSANVDLKQRRLIFRRLQSRKTMKELTKGKSAAGYSPTRDKDHPLIGWLKGTVRVRPGVDLTGPADPEWGEGHVG
jgi:hypothetical protein